MYNFAREERRKYLITCIYLFLFESKTIDNGTIRKREKN